jgi:hypothetical protein
MLLDKLRKRLTDSEFVVPGTNPPADRTFAIRGIRYRSAGMGFGLTRNDRRLARFHNRHAGQRCFVMGNGPSLNLCDLSFLREEITFGFNSIFLNQNKMGFPPTYYVVEDVLVAEDRRNEINEYAGPQAKFFGEYLRCFLEPTPETVWTNVIMEYDEYPGFPHFSKNAARSLWVGGTVSYLALQLAYFMGFREVYMIGFDHNYAVPKDIKQDGARWTSQSADPNHFHPDYFGKGYRWHDPQVDRMERSYLRAREVYEADGRVIRNATVGGRLEVLERVDYNTLFPGAPRPAGNGVGQ